MAKTEIDRDKLRVYLRRLRKDQLLALLDRAIDLVPGTRLTALVKGFVKPADLRPDDVAGGGLIGAVTEFRDASLRGEYYQDFMVNSKNFMEKSPGTETWIAECRRLLDRCLESAKKRPDRKVRDAFELLFGFSAMSTKGTTTSSSSRMRAVPTRWASTGRRSCPVTSQRSPAPPRRSSMLARLAA